MQEGARLSCPHVPCVHQYPQQDHIPIDDRDFLLASASLAVCITGLDKAWGLSSGQGITILHHF